MSSLAICFLFNSMQIMHVLLAVIVFVLSCIATFIWSNVRKTKEPPGPYRFPILGNIVQIGYLGGKEPYKAFTKMRETYGDIVSVKLGSINAVVINSYEMMQKYLTRPEFSDRYCNQWILERTFAKRLGIINGHYGTPSWQEVHKFTLRSLREFGFGKKTKLHSILEEEVTEAAEDLKRIAKENEGVVTIGRQFAVSNINLVWAMLAGKRYPLSDPRFKQMVDNVHGFTSSFNFASSFAFCYPNWYDKLPIQSDFVKLQRKRLQEINTFFKEFVVERRKLGVYLTEPECMVDDYLREIDSHQHEENTVYTDEQLVVLMTDFFFAGTLTTSSTMAWCILYLLLYPNIQKKVQAEIDTVVPKGTFPTLEHESKLHYVKATIAETHRIGTVPPLMGPRATVADTVCEDYIIPKGTFIVTNIHGIHYDKGYWKDPENFRPERFLDENGEFKNDDRIRSFGFGKRRCPGEALAQLDLIYFITKFMQDFSFLPAPGEPMPTNEPVVGIGNSPQVFRALLVCRKGH